MRGLQLQLVREDLRRRLRNAASVAGFQRLDFLALDTRELLIRAALDDMSAHGNAVKRQLILRGLSGSNVTVAEIAVAWRVSEEAIAEWKRPRLVDVSGLAGQIEAQVLEELPETPEPGRAPFVDAADNDRPGMHAYERARQAERAAQQASGAPTS